MQPTSCQLETALTYVAMLSIFTYTNPQTHREEIQNQKEKIAER